MLECAREKDAAWLVGRCVERVRRRRRKCEGFEDSRGGKAVVPLGMLGESRCGERAGGIAVGKNKRA